LKNISINQSHLTFLRKIILILGAHKKRIKQGCKVRLNTLLNVGFNLGNIKSDEIFSILQEGGKKK